MSGAGPSGAAQAGALSGGEAPAKARGRGCEAPAHCQARIYHQSTKKMNKDITKVYKITIKSCNSGEIYLKSFPVTGIPIRPQGQEPDPLPAPHSLGA